MPALAHGSFQVFKSKFCIYTHRLLQFRHGFQVYIFISLFGSLFQAFFVESLTNRAAQRNCHIEGGAVFRPILERKNVRWTERVSFNFNTPSRVTSIESSNEPRLPFASPCMRDGSVGAAATCHRT